jgi:hypothetical protein
MADRNTVVTPVVRLSYPNLFKARAIEEGATPKFSATLLFDKKAQSEPGFKKLQKAVEQAIDTKWGADRPKKLRLPFLTTADMENVPDGYEDDMIIIRTSSTQAPGVVDRQMQPILSEQDIYPGCYVRAAVHAYAWEHKTGGKGVSIGLDHVQFVKDGEAFTKRVKATDVFDEIEDEDDFI